MKSDNDMFEKYRIIWFSLSSKIQDQKLVKRRSRWKDTWFSILPAIAAVLVVAVGVNSVDASQYKHIRSSGNPSTINRAATPSNTEGQVPSSVVKSEGLHQDWSKVGKQAPNGLMGLVHVQGALYGYSESGDLRQFRDGNWSQQSKMPRGVVSMAFSGGRLYCATFSGVWVYQNGEWVVLNGSPKNASVLMDVSGALYVGVNTGTDGTLTNKGVWVYNHNSWSVVGNLPSRIISLIDVKGKCYASMETGVWLYTKGKWIKTTGAPKYVQSMADVNGTLYVTSGNFVPGMWAYHHGEWIRKGLLISNTVINCLQNVNGRLYAGTNSGVWLYENGMWTQVSHSLGTVLSLTSSNGTLYASTMSHGVQSIVVK